MSCGCKAAAPAEPTQPLPSGGICACQFVDAAVQWMGTPWVHQGRTRLGVDCVGLPIAVLRQLGAIALEYDTTDLERADYARNPRAGSLEAAVARHCIRIAEPVPGALLLFRLPDAIRHVGIFAGERRAGMGVTMIHADGSAPVRRVTECGYRGHWVTRTASVWALPGLDYTSGAHE